MSDIDPRFCWLCKKYNERHPCGEILGQCDEWKKFVNKAKAHQLKKKRVKSGLSQEKLGSRIYRSASWVSWVERGRIPINRGVAKEYLLGVLGGEA